MITWYSFWIKSFTLLTFTLDHFKKTLMRWKTQFTPLLCYRAIEQVVSEYVLSFLIRSTILRAYGNTRIRWRASTTRQSSLIEPIIIVGKLERYLLKSIDYQTWNMIENGYTSPTIEEVENHKPEDMEWKWNKNGFIIANFMSVLVCVLSRWN